MIQRPAYYPSWTQGTDDQVATPPDSLRQSGFVPGQPPVAQHFNALLYDLGRWVEYLDQSQNGAVLATTLDASVRLVGGGTLSYTAANTTLSWSEPLYLSVPSVADADNTIPAGQISIPAGSVAYVQANIPFSATGDVVAGDTAVQNVSFTLGISVGQTVTGAGIAAGTTVAAVDDTQVTLSQPATATQSAQALTFSGTTQLTVQTAAVSTFVPGANTVLLARGFGSYLFVGVNAQIAVLHNLEQRLLMEPGYTTIVRAPAGQAIAQGQVVYLSQDTSGTRTAGAVYPTDASATNGASRTNVLGFAVEAAATGAPCSVLSAGMLPGFSGLTPGAAAWLDPAAPGAITQTMPAASTTPYVVRVGLALTSGVLIVRPEHVGDGIFPTVQATVLANDGTQAAPGVAYASNPKTGLWHTPSTAQGGEQLAAVLNGAPQLILGPTGASLQQAASGSTILSILGSSGNVLGQIDRLGALALPSFVSSAGFKSNIACGSYYNGSYPGGTVNTSVVCGNQTGGTTAVALWTQPMTSAGSIVGISFYNFGTTTANFTGTVYINGVASLSIARNNAVTGATGSSYTNKGRYPFNAGDVLTATCGWSVAGNVGVQLYITVEHGA